MHVSKHVSPEMDEAFGGAQHSEDGGKDAGSGEDCGSTLASLCEPSTLSPDSFRPLQHPRRLHQ